ncbi:hypothetical protein [Rubellicoccus peritrichatus]|uniref:Uncharacterized protein n=1 Tax=Rubellicoccus peritrichatus TaxID=3080537 RepID=A0AAQ3L730_9BACT|nr:hypothetical protein [Puniceicoccus sp. CR14]WOO40407.1 hypothetical protein RZN69_17445 [Puniceicoccus sp. CR14]WOO40456.1 hypothetical protein RZN69_17690 [Puniceicoccus sp. CR14]WOO40505.1 hypothetical protein RZN69_17935 [Puniceicoccus sp. CR14]WOO40555.1 hypothetical protein RZN69_18185 [Puniceicoccus sp. CR14]
MSEEIEASNKVKLAASMIVEGKTLGYLYESQWKDASYELTFIIDALGDYRVHSKKWDEYVARLDDLVEKLKQVKAKAEGRES